MLQAFAYPFHLVKAYFQPSKPIQRRAQQALARVKLLSAPTVHPAVGRAQLSSCARKAALDARTVPSVIPHW